MAYTDKGPEAKTRHEIINPMLEASGWVVQHFKVANVYGSIGVAVEYFPMGAGVGEADYVLFVNGEACGIIEAKQEGETLTGKEPQSNRYASGFPKDFRYADLPLPFVYESSGSETRFTNLWDPKPRSRELFWFHKPEIMEAWLKEGKKTLRHRLTEMPASFNPLLWDIQKKAIQSLEGSLAVARPRALIQMATGSGKTFTAVNACYRLVKFGNATPQTIRRAMTELEIINLFQAAPVERKLLYAVAFTTGLRAGELRALTESHIDTENCGLILNAEWTKNRKPGFQPLPFSLLGNLQKFAKEKIASRLYGKFYHQFEDIDIPENPLLYVPSHPSREMDKDMELAGIPKATSSGKLDFHACRVAFITYVLEAGATVKEAQVLARHSTPLLTMNTYARAKDSRLTDLTEKVAERLLFQTPSHALPAGKDAGSNPDFSSGKTGQKQLVTDKKQKKCALCVPKGDNQDGIKKCKPLHNSNLHQFQGNGGGGIRTPVP